MTFFFFKKKNKHVVELIGLSNMLRWQMKPYALDRLLQIKVIWLVCSFDKRKSVMLL
jgi:hypothetical protein